MTPTWCTQFACSISERNNSHFRRDQQKCRHLRALAITTPQICCRTTKPIDVDDDDDANCYAALDLAETAIVVVQSN